MDRGVMLPPAEPCACGPLPGEVEELRGGARKASRAPACDKRIAVEGGGARAKVVAGSEAVGSGLPGPADRSVRLQRDFVSAYATRRMNRTQRSATMSKS